MNDYRIPSLMKACRILDLLAREQQGLTATEIARRVDLPRSTAFRVLQTLESEQMVTQRDRRYWAGASLLRLGLSALASDDLRTQAVPVLRRLADETRETAHLVVRAGGQGLILEVADGPDMVRVASRPGTLLWLHCSAAGKALLAGTDREQARALLSDTGMPRATPHTIADPDGMLAELERVRAEGYAVDDREYHEDVRCVAAPVTPSKRGSIAAIGITAAAARVTPERVPAVAETVKAAADELSHKLTSAQADDLAAQAKDIA